MTSTDDSEVPDYAGLLRLDDRAVVVLGAGQGIGRQAAHAVASMGARTYCVDKDGQLATEIAAEVGGLAGSGDVTRRDEVGRLFAEAEAGLGRIDGVVDIVGIARWMDLIDMDDDTWDSQFDVCLRHAMLAMQAGARAMTRSGGGSMAFVASVSGMYAAPRHGAYGAAKAGLMALVKTGAIEFAPLGIRVNAVAPGMTATPRALAAATATSRAEQEAVVPTGRLNRPSEIASALLFFLSDLSSNVTGQTLVVDGGVAAKFPYRSQMGAARPAGA